jgi:hypothetical protein
MPVYIALSARKNYRVNKHTNMTVEYPRARIIRPEANSDIFIIATDGHDVADNGVNLVNGLVACALNHPEGVLRRKYVNSEFPIDKIYLHHGGAY